MPMGRATRLAQYLGRLVGLALFLGLLAGGEIWHSYQQATSHAERSIAGLVGLLAEQKERTIQAIDLTLIGMRDALLLAPNLTPNDPAYRTALQERLKSLPYVRSLFVVGPDGFALHDSTEPPHPISLADRPYFKAHRDNAGLGLHITHPLRSVSTGVWFVSLSRRINNPDGSFGGVVVAATEPRYLTTFYEGLSLDKDSVIAFALKDGTILWHAQNPEETIGKSHANSPAHKLAMERGSGVTWAASPIDGITRVVGYRTLADGAVVVVAGWSEAMVYDAWRERTAVVGGGAVLVWALASGLMLLQLKQRHRDRLEQVRAAQAQRLEMMGRIAGGIAHDLGNTVKIARTTFSLLRPSLASQREALQLVDDSDRSLKSAFDIIDRLLAFARRQELNPSATDLSELIAGFAPILRQAAGPHAELDLDIAKALVCRVDPIHLESALLNLVLNSKDAMPDGGRIVIEVREAQAPTGRRLGRTRLRARAPARPWAEIVVRDDGVGMSREVQERVFEPFFTTRNGGSGLGLSQVLGFVQQSAGEIRIESREGGGTTVRLLFPTTPDPAETAISPSSGSTELAGT